MNTYLHGFRNRIVLLYADGFQKCTNTHMYVFCRVVHRANTLGQTWRLRYLLSCYYLLLVLLRFLHSPKYLFFQTSVPNCSGPTGPRFLCALAIPGIELLSFKYHLSLKWLSYSYFSGFESEFFQSRFSICRYVFVIYSPTSSLEYET